MKLNFPAHIASLMRRVHHLYNVLGNMPYRTRAWQLQQNILHSDVPGVTGRRYLPGSDTEIVVSLTSYGRRILNVANTVESIMQQTWLPNRIVLWLGEEERQKPLPEALERQRRRGLEVRYVRDLRSFTKLVPALEAMTDAAIITVDDDVLYEYDVVERLIRSYIASPEAISAMRGWIVTHDRRGRLLPYNDWRHVAPDAPSPVSGMFFTGVGGVLYPPRSLDSRVTDSEAFLRLCPYADDIWFNIMATLRGTPVVKVPTVDADGSDYVGDTSVADTALESRNVGRRANDAQLRAVLDAYGPVAGY